MEVDDRYKKLGRKLAMMNVYYKIMDLKAQYARASRLNDTERMKEIIAEHKRMSELFQKLREESI